MQSDEGQPTKPERQRLIVTLISSRPIGTQLELQTALAGVGCTVTQATVSRDLRDLGIQKRRDPLGQPRYAVAEGTRRGDPEDALASVLRHFARRAVASQNLVVIRCELGTAPAVGRALERTENPRILGTIAGDDTCLAIAKGLREARSVARALQRSITT